MPTTIKFGQVQYILYSKEELEKLGLVHNPNMYIGDGWRFCVNCNHYAYVIAMSHRGQSDCFEVCIDCNNHHRAANRPIIN